MALTAREIEIINNLSPAAYEVQLGTRLNAVISGDVDPGSIDLVDLATPVAPAFIDIAAGTTQNEQAARFPNGVAAVSDASMTDWMEYVYMQRPRPMDTVGVEVVIEALYPDNSYKEIGRTTTDQSGMFSLKFEPTAPGTYTVIARFEGTNGYWPSFAETSVGIDPAPTTEDTDLTSLENSVSDIESNMSSMLTYILAILVIVIIALLVAIFSLLKSRK